MSLEADHTRDDQDIARGTSQENIGINKLLDKMGAFNLETCARPNILALEPYRCARE
jgi:hypothetical protein